MCGIVGEVNFTQTVDSRRVDRMANAIRHRGPDDNGSFLSPSGYCALAHRRLSIIDLSTKAHQPMHTEDGLQVIVFNGEIYNFKELKEQLMQEGEVFHSQSDTEVLLKLWVSKGLKSLDMIRGMFAFGIWDEEEKSLTLVRDPLGIKPLYYRHDKDRLIFASEVKALRSVGLASGIDPTGLGLFLKWGSIPAPATIHPCVKSLPAGCWLRFSKNGLETGIYWNHTQTILNVRSEIKEIHLTRQQAISLTRETLLESVNAHLVSDVPVGAFLSGGIDSTTVVSLMRQAGQKDIATFSISFDEPNFDESFYSQLAAKTYNTDHHEWVLTPGEFLSAKQEFLACLDQPTIDGINTFIVSRIAHEYGFKVVTSGVGGDEFFAGYKGTFQDMPRLIGYLAHIPGSALTGCAGFINALIKSGMISPTWGRFSHLLSGEVNLVRGYDMWRGLFSPKEIKNLFQNKSLGNEVAAVQTEQLLSQELRDISPRERITVLEVFRFLGSQLLPDSDVFSMAHSLELRVPLVDRIVAESLSLVREDSLFLSTNGVAKPLLVEAAGDLPPELVFRKKRGFTFPLNSWLRMEKWGPKSGLFDEAACRKVDELYRRGKLHWSRRWALEVIDSLAAQ